MNLINANRIEWAERKSLEGKSERASQSIGRAMKAQEAGHLFDLQRLRVPLGKRPWPNHYHASQREI
jgi:hypothetical protein